MVSVPAEGRNPGHEGPPGTSVGRGTFPEPTLPPPDRLGSSLLVATVGLAGKQAGKVALGPLLGLGWGAGGPSGGAASCHTLPQTASPFPLPLLSPVAFPFRCLHLREARGKGTAECHLAWAGPALREEGRLPLGEPLGPDSVTSLHLLQTNKTDESHTRGPPPAFVLHGRCSRSPRVWAGIRVGEAFCSPLQKTVTLTTATRLDTGGRRKGAAPRQTKEKM